jgi:hypothetical protein
VAGGGLRPGTSLGTRSERTGGPLRIGIGGPVGSGKTALVAALCRALRTSSLAVVTNDIYTTEDADFLLRQGVLPNPSGSARSRPAAARTPRSATTSAPTSRPSRTSKQRFGRSTSSWSRAAATTSPRPSARA